jgi:UDP-N-acetylmuramate--alanine ligase
MDSELIIDFSKIKKVHLIGIKGVAMTSLAEILAGHGIKISGSDTEEIFFTDALLKKINARLFVGFKKENLLSANADLIIYSTAYNPKANPELAAALKSEPPVLSYPEALGLLFNQSIGVAVSGTHGKTTTTAMLGEILQKNKKEPTVLVGSKIINWDSASLIGNGPHFIAEADEYQNKLRFLNPKGAITTNIDFDHPDFFLNPEEYQKVFRDFFCRLPRNGFLVFNADDSESQRAVKGLATKMISFGKNQAADFRLEKREVGNAGFQTVSFTFSEHLFSFKLFLTGEHNALNALAAIAAAQELGVSIEESLLALEGFLGSERRFQKMGEKEGVLFYDDYAHHPAEIEATLLGAKEFFPGKKIIVAFHPHTFTRTKRLLPEFALALTMADECFILDIYASAREEAGKIKVHARDLVSLINKEGGRAFYAPQIKDLTKAVIDKLKPNTLFLTMGAGDIWKAHDQLLKNNLLTSPC